MAADINHANPWCNCQLGFSGEYCELSDCPLDVMVPGHGQCVNRQIQYCYAPYDGSRCQNDNCANYNGTVVVDANNIPSGCRCPVGWNNTLNGQVVASCWPTCVEYQGAMCGPTDGSTQHICNQQQNADGTRYANCLCGNGYVEIDHPTMPGVKVCEKWCAHGVPSSSFTPTSPGECQCAPETGYFTNGGNDLRCNTSICGTANQFVNGACQCQPPYISNYQSCTLNNCGARGIVVNWTDPSATSAFRCLCPEPSRVTNPLAPFDCQGTVCSPDGYLNPFFTSLSPPTLFCMCRGKRQTVCIGSNCKVSLIILTIIGDRHRDRQKETIISVLTTLNCSCFVAYAFLFVVLSSRYLFEFRIYRANKSKCMQLSISIFEWSQRNMRNNTMLVARNKYECSRRMQMQ